MPQRTPGAVGAHVFAAGGLASGALTRARAIGAEAVQVFVSNPRGWAPAAGDPAQDERFRAGCGEAGMPVFVHAPYLVDLGSPSEATRAASAAALGHSLRRGAAIGATGVVFHAGSAVRGTRADALRRVRDLLPPLLDTAADLGVRLLVEPTAGGGSALAATVDELAGHLEAVDGHGALGVCVDTCHLLGAGHDIASAAGMRATLTALGRVLGAGRLGLVHANDARDPCGSHRDRHAPIGHGLIGVEPFGALLRHPLTRGVPVVVETPGDEESHRRDLAALKRLRDR